jgi:hypothetical protein
VETLLDNLLGWIAPRGAMRIPVRLAAALTFSVAATVAQAGCFRCEPILNVTGAVVAAPAGKPLSADQVRASIIRAGAALGWQIREDRPGHLLGTLDLRSHTAVVEIPYSATSYGIQYKSSIDLHEGDGQIHKNYNGWIRNLIKGINAQFLQS